MAELNVSGRCQAVQGLTVTKFHAHRMAHHMPLCLMSNQGCWLDDQLQDFKSQAWQGYCSLRCDVAVAAATLHSQYACPREKSHSAFACLLLVGETAQ